MIVRRDIVQGTPEWQEVRSIIPTASEFSRIMTPGRRASKSAGRYMADLLAARILGHALDDAFISQWMARGSDLEGRAVSSYELSHDCEAERIGFVSDDSGLVGCSPDRFIIGDNGMLEVKCPSPGVHVEYLIAKSKDGLDRDYYTQAMGQLWICERDYVDILSWHPDMPEVVIRMERDEEFITELEAHVRSFSRQLEEIAADFVARGWIKPRVERTVVEDLDAEPFLTDDDIAWAMSHAEEHN